ncbi:hypothetical protein R6258_13365 [Halomonas sp. HP20-15]|uniref:hypothetical protein n=1 Tax=Halomonas sp. HP20-15 TaxID=3085901 RepID=UPI0029816A22|nr:hypothetical protein [Halomonas sp. HP20-15]MDW5377914.1 hypothetical protein [Halomonas sp. HP20-15]
MQNNVSIMPVSDSGILRQAIEHEASEKGRYHILALRYLTLRNNLSKLMSDLTSECQGRLDRLIETDITHEVPYDVFLTTPLLFDMSQKGKHFFFLREAVAFQSLDEAHFLAHSSLCRYRTWVRHLSHGNLRTLLNDILAQKEAECRILHAFQTHWPETPSYPGFEERSKSERNEAERKRQGAE